MTTRRLRWLCLLLSLFFLLKVVFGTASTWSVAGFFGFGAAWYGLTWMKTRELDSRKPR